MTESNTPEGSSPAPQHAMKPDGIRRGIFVYEKSPFMMMGVVQAKTKRITNKTGDMTLISSTTGEIMAPVAGFWTAKKVDSSKFVKLYVDGVKRLTELSGAGTKVFEIMYLQMQSSPGEDKIMLSWYMLEKGRISKAHWKRGLSELLEKGFIAATTIPSLYWINPSYVFNGDRLAFVEAYYRDSPAGKAETASGTQLTIFDEIINQ